MKTFGTSNRDIRGTHALGCIALIAILAIAPACKQRDKADAGTSTTTTTEKNGPTSAAIITAADTTKMFLRAKPNEEYTTYTHEYSSFTGSCSIDKGVSVDKLCFLEAEELDLWFWGVELEFNVPAQTCPYVKVIAPYYWKLQAGIGPATVSYSTSGGAVTDIANTVGGAAICPYDYTAGGGPNCCTGTYTRVVGNTVGGVTTWTTTPNVSWGGDATNCLGGVGMDVNAKASGWPIWTIVNTWKSGYSKTMTVTAPSQKPYAGNVRVANYFQLADYFSAAATLPNPYKPTVTPTAAGIFGPYSAVVGSPGSAIKTQTEPYFEFICMDRNEDIISRIRMMIRSWDTAGYLDLTRAYSYYDSNQPNGSSQSATFPIYGTDPGVAYHDMSIMNDVHPYPYAAPAAWTPDGTAATRYPSNFPYLIE